MLITISLLFPLPLLYPFILYGMRATVYTGLVSPEALTPRGANKIPVPVPRTPTRKQQQKHVVIWAPDAMRATPRPTLGLSRTIQSSCGCHVPWAISALKENWLQGFESKGATEVDHTACAPDGEIVLSLAPSAASPLASPLARCRTWKDVSGPQSSLQRVCTRDQTGRQPRHCE